MSTVSNTGRWEHTRQVYLQRTHTCTPVHTEEPSRVVSERVVSPSVLHQSCLILRDEVRQEICHTPLLQ